MRYGFSKQTLWATFSCLAVAMATPAQAENANINVRYGVDVKGMTIMKLKFSARLDGDAYATEISGKTTGMANWFSDYRVEMGTQGVVRNGEFLPENFSRERRKNGKKREATTTWVSGAPQISEENGGDAFQAMAGVVDASTLDPLSMLVGLSLRGGKGPCQGNRRVFDGRDVYDVVISGGQNEDEGRISCQIKLNYVAGKEVEDAKPDAAKPDVYGVVLRPVEAASLGRVIWLPERISGRASGQNFVAKSKDLDIQ